MKKYGYIYKITHIPSGRYYIGQHKSETFDEDYWGNGRIIKNMYLHHDKSEFSREVIKWAYSAEELNLLEQEFVNEETVLDKNCLNLKTGGDVCIFTEELKNRVRKAMTKEVRKKISDKAKARVVSEEQKMKTSKALKGRPSPFKGKVASDETRKKLSKAITGRKWFTNGKENKFVRNCPKGYYRGRTAKKESNRWKGHVTTEEDRRWFREIGLKGLISQGRKVSI